ncbi:MAG: hypothetical protein Q9178_007527 [Gyalolechia marmorata]
MKISSCFLALLASSAVIATPFSKARYQKRQKANIAKSILELIGVAIGSKDASAWDYSAHPSMCSIILRTKGGGHCHADVTCSDKNKRNYDNWGACYHQGVNKFNDPGIGPFSVVFTKKNDDCGDGLCAPFLALEYVGNYFNFDVDALSEETSKYKYCPIASYCGKASENICRGGGGHEDGTISNQCGVPAIGRNYGPGKLDSQGPVNSAGYAGGWCGIHVVQYQKKKPKGNPVTDPNARYHMDVTIFDSNQDNIGEVLGADPLAGEPIEITSKLPHVMLVTTQKVDADPVLFAYSDQSWAYADVAHQCNFGQYDSGKREGDCGFSC